MDAESADAQRQELAACLAQAAAADVTAQAGLLTAERAWALASQLQDEQSLAVAWFWRCAFLMRLGRHAELLSHAPEALQQLTAPERTEQRRELLWCVTLCASEIGRFDQALDAAHELVAQAKTAQDPLQSLVSAYALAVCLERMGDSWQADRLLREALQAYGSDAPSRAWLVAANAVAAVGIGMAHRLTGTGSDPERQDILQTARWHTEQALAQLEALRDPMYDAAVPGNLGEIYLLQGDLAGAKPLLDRALANAHGKQLHAHAWRIRTSLADWSLASGQALQALMAAEQLLHEMGSAAPQQTAIRAHDTAYRACRVLRRYKQALVHLEAAERLDRTRTLSQLKAQSQLFVTRVEAQNARSQAELARADAQHQREQAARFAAEAERDPLTGLGNRRHLQRRCADILPAAEREQLPLVVAVLDIDHFKQVNDTHGHAVGDRVLVAMAQLLREKTRAGDVLVRQGGEEFVMVLPGMGTARALEFCERLREGLAHYPWADQGLPAEGITVSIGLAAAAPYRLDELLQAADAVLFRAKDEGRNRVVMASR
jgi:diguanylate cyclase